MEGRAPKCLSEAGLENPSSGASNGEREREPDGPRCGISSSSSYSEEERERVGDAKGNLKPLACEASETL